MNKTTRRLLLERTIYYMMVLKENSSIMQPEVRDAIIYSIILLHEKHKRINKI